MSLYPHARHLLLPESDTQPRITPRVLIFHSAAGTGSLYRFFLGGSSLESHFWIGLDGTVEQYIDTDVRADANYKANPFAISVETENHRDHVKRRDWDGDPWTPEQIEASIALGDWCARTHPIARQLCPTWDGTGIGWHIQFGTPGKWTPVAKACPGRKRIDQVKTEIIPGVIAMQHPQPEPEPTPEPEDDDMAPIAVRDSKDRKVWICTATPAPSRWHVPDSATLTALLVTGAARVNGPNGTPAEVPSEHLAKFPVAK